MHSQAQVAGPSRIPGTVSSKERLLMSTKKAGRILGEGISTSFLRLEGSEQNRDMRTSEVVLNSPDNALPLPSPWDSPEDKSMASSSIVNSSKATSQTTFPTSQRSTIDPHYRSNKKLSASTSSTESAVYVAPLNIKPRIRRKSLSLAAIELDKSMFISPDQSHISTDSVSSQYHSQGTRRKQLPNTPVSQFPPSRSASLNGTPESLVRSQSLRRNPRPLPPVPNGRASICISPTPGSRPASPSGSISSFSSSNNAHLALRPLPVPPAVEGSPCPSASSSSSGPSPRPSPRIVCDLPAHSSLLVVTNPSSSPVSPATSLSPLEFAEDSEPPSPHTPLSPTSGITNLSILSPSPKKLRPARRKSRVHASPYKLALRGGPMGPARFSTTSLSSQVSVPPIPPAAELRRRNRDKMAKLMRVLGESPPSDLVFSPENSDSPRLNKVAEEDRKIFIPHFRSASIDTQFSMMSEFDKSRKALSDPEAGHGLQVKSSNNNTTTISQQRSRSPSGFLRLRPKRGRTGVTAARYVVSLGGTDHERLTFRVLGDGPFAKKKPSGSYLRGAYALDAKESKTCVYESGETRWEIDDYEKVVKSLRKL